MVADKPFDNLLRQSLCITVAPLLKQQVKEQLRHLFQVRLVLQRELLFFLVDYQQPVKRFLYLVAVILCYQ